jgi:hypothetical protein
VGVAAAFYWAGHRNAVGGSGPVFYLGRERWSPPVPYTVLVVLAVGAIAALVVLFLRLIAAEERAERPSDASRPDPVPGGGIGAS